MLKTETLTKKRTRLKLITKRLAVEYPGAKISLNFKSPFQLLVSTILSAQCTDDRVNMVTTELFKKFKTPVDFADASVEELEQAIFSTGFYKAKAKNIKAAAKMIIDVFSGNVPSNMDDLLKLPGVGRKTANVILGHCFKPVGVVVDTHVIRISNRLNLVQSNNPIIIERILLDLLPEKNWMIFTHYIINHGRKICKARKPLCGNCSISQLCPSKNLFLSSSIK